ncbi:hypothetical protein [Chryseolinea lacunae]|uniref:Uncharacterized protein n=1 Tax=Chryseolinea lacunae TaxID=2801331 RepID=A0ABS1KRQ3_9BACT|nr:hypothetical protein [Chryseolinea lacunae]MBL0742025.1 hypothetical protein [Chryseolinea lacunae]
MSMQDNVNEYLEMTRLRSARRRKRAQREDFDKMLIGLSRERRALARKQWREALFEKLEKPYQHGWIRKFVVRPDVARGKDGAFFQRLLDKINNTKFSHRKDFKVKKRRFGRKIYVEKPQEFEQLSPYEFGRKKFSDKEKSFFELVYHFDPKTKQHYPKYALTETWRFRLRVFPNIITRRRIIRGEVEGRLDQIKQYITRNNFEPRLQKLLSGHYGWGRWNDDDDLRKIDSFRNKPLVEILNKHWPEENTNTNPRIDPGVSFFANATISFLVLTNLFEVWLGHKKETPAFRPGFLL